jgi:hypothetical protein
MLCLDHLPVGVQKFRDRSAVGLYVKACSQAQRQDREELNDFERVGRCERGVT